MSASLEHREVSDPPDTTTHIVGSLPYQDTKTIAASHPANAPGLPPAKRRKPRQFSCVSDLRHQYKTLDKQREALYTHGGQLVTKGETVTGRELETKVASVLELEMALCSGDLTNAEKQAFQLSLVSGLARSEIAERLGVSQRRVGNLIGSATRKLVSFVYDQAA